MHSNAVIISTLTGLRFTQCPKCQERYVLSLGFVHGSHLCCKGCGENLLLQELSMGELENFNAAEAVKARNWSLEPRRIQPSKMSMSGSCSGDAVLTAREMTKQLQERGFLVRTNVGSQPRVADITGFAVGRRYEYDVGEGGKTAVIIGTKIHQAMDASQRNEKLKQELTRQYVAKAAFKLGTSATLGVESDRQRAKQKAIKAELATSLRACGIPYLEIELIIHDMVEAIRNV
jgi:hypothetical protein